jgi:hypothetical protein
VSSFIEEHRERFGVEPVLDAVEVVADQFVEAVALVFGDRCRDGHAPSFR